MTESTTWPIFAYVGLAIGGLLLYLLPTTSTKRILEIKCINDDLFDGAKRCNTVARVQPGTVMDVTVNTTTQHILVEVVESTEGWDRAFILDHCAVVSAKNWRCLSESKIGFTEATATVVRNEFGMIQGRFYRSYTSKDPPNFYSSSISGWQYWGYRTGLLSLNDAIELSR
jgi:hypothetical protein